MGTFISSIEGFGRSRPDEHDKMGLPVPETPAELPPGSQPTGRGLWPASRMQWAIVWTIIAWMFACFCLPVVNFQTHGRPNICRHHLKEIGLALQNYHDVHKCFPPAYFTDQNGRPAHSWRVLILPY